jgi:hypothetical protein
MTNDVIQITLYFKNKNKKQRLKLRKYGSFLALPILKA